MLIDDAVREATRLQASLRAMRADGSAIDEAGLLCLALEHDPIENVLEFALDALERIDAHLPNGALAGLVRVRLKNLAGIILLLRENASEISPDSMTRG